MYCRACSSPAATRYERLAGSTRTNASKATVSRLPAAKYPAAMVSSYRSVISGRAALLGNRLSGWRMILLLFAANLVHRTCSRDNMAMQYWLPIEEGLYRLAGRLAGYALIRDGKCLIVDPPRIDWSAALAELGVPRATGSSPRTTTATAWPVRLTLSPAAPSSSRQPAKLTSSPVPRTSGRPPAPTSSTTATASSPPCAKASPSRAAWRPASPLPLGPWQVSVLPLRGHTRHHTGYVVNHASRRLAFVGAAMAGSGTVHNWCDFHWDYMDFNKGHRALLADLDALAAAGPDLLCPSHAQPLSDVAGEIDLLRGNLRCFSDLVEPNRIPRQRDEVYQILPHVWFIGQTCYGIVADDGAALLFDVGYPEPTRPRLTRVLPPGEREAHRGDRLQPLPRRPLLAGDRGGPRLLRHAARYAPRRDLVAPRSGGDLRGSRPLPLSLPHARPDAHRPRVRRRALRLPRHPDALRLPAGADVLACRPGRRRRWPADRLHGRQHLAAGNRGSPRWWGRSSAAIATCPA